jgi:Dyp-type peroxidase family
MADIQGIAVPGFLKPHQTLLGITFTAETASVSAVKKLLVSFAAQISNAAVTLDDRRRYRLRAAATEGLQALTGIGFTFQGLSKLTPGSSAMPDVAFRQGLAARSAFLGDPEDPAVDGNPAKWIVGGTGHELDGLIVIAGDTRDSVNARSAEVAKVWREAGCTIAFEENGDIREDLPGHEHFGFDDGVSQPGIRGRASQDADDFITPRHISPKEEPAHSLFGYPGQDLVWPGVLLLGHPASSPDPLIPGLASPAVPEWTTNGSYLVFRRLQQDVGLFWRTMKRQAEALATKPGFEKINDETLASRIVGRWTSGAPVNRTPQADNASLGRDKLANNHFRFDSDAAALKLTGSHQDSYPQSKADPAGTTCPWAAHIRKVNTRDSGSDTGGRDSTYSRRLLRIGVPYGKQLKNRYAELADDPEEGKRGLLFLSIQASIDDQFEFLAARWMGDPTRPKNPGGHDILVGQNNAPGEDRQRRCVIFGKGFEQAEIVTNAQWIVPTGGGYFFVPSIPCLRTVLAGPIDGNS